MKTRKVYIQTIGCQMNMYDSGKMSALLGAMNYTETESLNDADVIIVNTCAIREKAVQKAHSFIGRIRFLKQKNKNLKLVVAGCVAQQQGMDLIHRFPFIDVVLGTQVIHRLPDLLKTAEYNCAPVMDIEMPHAPIEYRLGNIADAPIHSAVNVCEFVTIMRGCDNYCAYCVVPYVRGREVSRRPEDIINEIHQLVQIGVKEITLLGQNVNSYGKKEGLLSFPRLLKMINKIEGLQRIRFVTSHPKDLSDELIESFSSLEKLCNHIHLPVQSGSDRILEKMNRKYTRHEYVQKVEKLRKASPDIAVTTDIIVGFPGEADQDFQMTIDLMKTVCFDHLFVFEYSDRPDAPSSHFPDKVPGDLKHQRLQQVLQLQQQISKQKDSDLIGKVFPVLVEGISKKQLQFRPSSNASEIELTGRTSENRIVNFAVQTDCGLDIEAVKGEIIPIRINQVFSNSLWGTPEGKVFFKSKRRTILCCMK